jgi:hypothetical protein
MEKEKIMKILLVDYLLKHGQNGLAQLMFNLIILLCRMKFGLIHLYNTKKIIVTTSQTPIKNRRIGTCQDGIYTIKQNFTDTAGNTSKEWIERIERDTVAPGTPVVTTSLNGSRNYEKLNLRIEGEGDVTATINVNSSSGKKWNLNTKLNSQGIFNTSNLIGNLACGKFKYDITVQLTDRAGNQSSIISGSVTTQECLVCTRVGNGTLLRPLRGATARDSIGGQFGQYAYGSHAGLDMYDYVGAPVYAAASGTVVAVVMGNADNGYAGNPAGYANRVIIKHTINDSKGTRDIYTLDFLHKSFYF